MQHKLSSVIPQILDAGLMDMTTITIMLSIFSFAGIIFAIPAGALVGKIGPKKTILLASLITSLSSLAVFADNMMVFIVFRALEGISLILAVVAGPVLIQQVVEPARRGIAVGIIICAGGLGAFIAGFIVPRLFNAGELVAVWLGLGVFALMTGTIFFFTVKDKASCVEGSTGKMGDTAAVVEKPSYTSIFTKNTLLLFASLIVFHLMLIATVSFSPTFLQQHGVNPNMSGVISTIPMLLGILSSVLFGALADKTHKYKILYLIGFIGMSAGVFLMFTNTGAELWIGAAAVGLLGLGTPAIAMAVFPQMLRSPTLISMGIGVLTVVQCFGQFLGTSLPPFLLGEGLNNWVLMQFVLLGLGAAGLIAALACSFKKEGTLDQN